GREATANAAPSDSPGSRLCGDRREQVVAGLLAAAANLRTDAAVLVVSGVALALLSACFASRRARFEHCGHEAQIRLALPRHYTACRFAAVGAVEAEPNGANKLLHVGLARAGIGAGRAAGGAVEAFLDAAKERVAIQAARLRMQLDDLLKPHGSPLVWAR